MNDGIKDKPVNTELANIADPIDPQTLKSEMARDKRNPDLRHMDPAVEPEVDVELPARQRAFAYIYTTNGFDTNKAVYDAGYCQENPTPKNLERVGNYLLDQPAVQAWIRRRMWEHEQASKVTSERVVVEMSRIAFVKITDIIDMSKAEALEDYDDESGTLTVKDLSVITDDAKATIKSIKKLNNGSYEVKLYDKMVALDKLAKIKGLYIDRFEIDAGSGGTISGQGKTPQVHMHFVVPKEEKVDPVTGAIDVEYEEIDTGENVIDTGKPND